jgi:hypothetical protein
LNNLEKGRNQLDFDAGEAAKLLWRWVRGPGSGSSVLGSLTSDVFLS